MTLKEIKKAVDNGQKVYWSNRAYEVKKYDKDYYIVCSLNDHTIGLTWRDNKTLNGKESEFFTMSDKEIAIIKGLEMGRAIKELKRN